MASIWDNLFAKGEYGFPKAATDICPPSATTQQMKARTDELEATWEPTGYYSWQEMSNLLAAAVEMSSHASSAAVNAFQESPSDILRQATAEYVDVVRKANEDYQPAWKRAQATNTPISAPGFKRWVIDLLRSAHKLMRVSEISVCLKPWWLGAVQTFMYYFNKVADIAKSIGHIVVAAGSAVVSAVEGVFSLIPFVKWGGIIVGVVFLGAYIHGRFKYIHGAAERGDQVFHFDPRRIFSPVRSYFDRRSQRKDIRHLFRKHYGSKPATVAGRRLLR